MDDRDSPNHPKERRHRTLVTRKLWTRRFWRHKWVQLRWHIKRQRDPKRYSPASGTRRLRRLLRYKAVQLCWCIKRRKKQRATWTAPSNKVHLPWRAKAATFRRNARLHTPHLLPLGVTLVTVLLGGAWAFPVAASTPNSDPGRPAVHRSPPPTPIPVVRVAPPRVSIIAAPLPTPDTVLWTESPIPVTRTLRPAPAIQHPPQIRTIGDGWAAHYAPNVMGHVISVRQEGQVKHSLPPFDPTAYLGYVARPDCEDVGQEIWLDFGQGWVGPFLVADCAHPADRQHIEARGIVTELGYPSAVRFGVTHTGGRQVQVGRAVTSPIAAAP